MAKEHHYYVYILSSRSRTLYIGVTNALIGRLIEHREGRADAFTQRYRIHRLVYFERFRYINNAIAREKFLKHMTRAEKLALIGVGNPTWEDLSVAILKRFERMARVAKAVRGDRMDGREAGPPLREG
jgi:putative endonuclease